MRKSLVMLAVSLALLSACADEKVTPQMSPCVGLDDSPCGPKRPVNQKSREMVRLAPAAVLAAV